MIPAGANHMELLTRLASPQPLPGSMIEPIRQAARARFEALGFPGSKAEAWRYTPVAPMVQPAFQSQAERAAVVDAGPRHGAVVSEALGADGVGLVFVNGRFSADLSKLPRSVEGLFVGNLSDALRRGDEEVKRHLARYASFQEQPFTALNTALVDDGAVVVLSPGAVAAQPIHLLYLSTASEAAGAPTASQPRTLVVAGEGSRVQLVESYVGLGGVTLTNAVTEVMVGNGASVDQVTLLREGAAAFHIGTTQASVASGGHFGSTAITLSGARIRRELNVLLGGEGARTTLDGLYLVGATQHVDQRTFVDHSVPGCESQENYRGVVGGGATAVFDGRVLVRPNAQRSNANLTNRNLLLSDSASIYAKPMLEIFADDVKATHGEAVGRLDTDSLFYLRARGISEVAAREMLVLAFARDVLEHVAVPGLSPLLDRLVAEALVRLWEKT